MLAWDYFHGDNTIEDNIFKAQKYCSAASLKYIQSDRRNMKLVQDYAENAISFALFNKNWRQDIVETYLRAMLRKGVAVGFGGNVNEAEKTFTELWNKSAHLQDLNQKNDILWKAEYNLADMLIGEGRFTEAQLHSEKAKELSAPFKDNYINFLILQQSANATVDDLEKRIAKLREAYELADKVSEISKAILLGSLVQNLTEINKISEAETLMPELNVLVEKTKSIDAKARMYWASGKIAASKGKREEAIYQHELAEKELLNQGVEYSLRDFYRNWTEIFISMKDSARASETFQKFEKVCKSEITLNKLKEKIKNI